MAQQVSSASGRLRLNACITSQRYSLDPLSLSSLSLSLSGPTTWGTVQQERAVAAVAAVTFARATAVAANDRKVFGMRVQHLSASLWPNEGALARSAHTHTVLHTYRRRWACACPDADTDVGIETRIARSSSKEIFVFAIRINKNFTRQLPHPLLTCSPPSLPSCFRGNFINWKSHLRVNFLKEIFALFSRNRISISYENCQTTDEGGKRRGERGWLSPAMMNSTNTWTKHGAVCLAVCLGIYSRQIPWKQSQARAEQS